MRWLSFKEAAFTELGLYFSSIATLSKLVRIPALSFGVTYDIAAASIILSEEILVLLRITWQRYTKSTAIPDVYTRILALPYYYYIMP